MDATGLRIGGWGVAAAGLTLALCSRGAKRTGIIYASLVRLGVMSYSFYLLHQPLLLLAGPSIVGLTRDPLLLYGSAIAIGLPAAALIVSGFYLVVERPSLVSGGMRSVIVPMEIASRSNTQISA